jgi:hypothetical protein
MWSVKVNTKSALQCHPERSEGSAPSLTARSLNGQVVHEEWKAPISNVHTRMKAILRFAQDDIEGLFDESRE